MKIIVIILILGFTLTAEDRPNILFCFSDDWGRYASIYQDSKISGLNDVIKTPALDEVGNLYYSSMPLSIAAAMLFFIIRNIQERILTKNCRGFLKSY